MKTDIEVHGIDDYKAGFFGGCFGIVLTPRGKDDNAVMFQVVTEDDGNWFKDEKSDGNAYWIPDLLAQLIHAKDWLEENAIQRTSGYEFKE